MQERCTYELDQIPLRGVTDSYQRPNVNTSTTVIFLLDFMFIFQTALTGSNNMMKSVTVLKMPLTFNNSGVSIQEPGILGLNIFSLGRHSQILVMFVAV